MSQAKVDAYKAAKKTRKEDIKKAKAAAARKRVIGWIVGILIIVGLVAGIVITIVNAQKAKTAETKAKYTAQGYLLNDYADIVDEEPGE